MYPDLSERVKASIIDAFSIIILMYIMSLIFQSEDTANINLRIVAFVTIFFLYDPLMTSLLGGTIGHFIIGLRVRQINNEDKKIGFPQAIIRFVIKVLLGWVSLLTVTSDEKHRALHDKAVMSIIVYK